jgi:hypothetical protein
MQVLHPVRRQHKDTIRVCLQGQEQSFGCSLSCLQTWIFRGHRARLTQRVQRSRGCPGLTT